MYNCKFCDKEFIILDQLGNHIMNTHVPSGEAKRFMKKKNGMITGIKEHGFELPENPDGKVSRELLK